MIIIVKRKEYMNRKGLSLQEDKNWPTKATNGCKPFLEKPLRGSFSNRGAQDPRSFAEIMYFRDGNRIEVAWLRGIREKERD
jgi:hypothetical protein